MTTTNVYFTHGTRNEQYLVEDLIIESLRMYGNEVMYIPRTLVSKDDVLGEDRLSEFKTAFPIEMYFENVDSFGGQGAFIQKFGLMIEQSATLVCARRRWEQFIGRYGATTIPTRPNEGDLIYFPLSKGLFEIKFVQHQDPFYQLGKLYVYKLQVELFQYSSERIDTGIPSVDVFETLKTFSTNATRSEAGQLKSLTIVSPGNGYVTAPAITFIGGGGYGAAATATLGTGENSDKVVSVEITNPGTGYNTVPAVNVASPPTGDAANIEAAIEVDLHKQTAFSENTTFKTESAGILNFDEHNPFGEINNA
jgi:hypothetical protein